MQNLAHLVVALFGQAFAEHVANTSELGDGFVSHRLADKVPVLL